MAGIFLILLRPTLVRPAADPLRLQMNACIHDRRVQVVAKLYPLTAKQLLAVPPSGGPRVCFQIKLVWMPHRFSPKVDPFFSPAHGKQTFS